MARRTIDHRDGQRASGLGRIWRGTKATIKVPFSTFPAAAVLGNARLIRQLFNQVRQGEQENVRNRTYRTEDGRIDLVATAFGLGLNAVSLELRIARRRRQTARVAYSSFGLGCLFVLLWIWRELTSRLSGTNIVGALEFIPFVAIFFLVAFKSAHANWQLRTGRLGSAADYLRSPEPFLPRST